MLTGSPAAGVWQLFFQVLISPETHCPFYEALYFFFFPLFLAVFMLLINYQIFPPGVSQIHLLLFLMVAGSAVDLTWASLALSPFIP